MVDFDEIRKEVAIKHGILLDEDDPLLMTVTINELILSQYVEMVASQNAEYVKKLTDAVDASIQKGIAESKVVAGRVITEGSNYVSNQVSTQAKTAIDSAITEGGLQLLQRQYNLLQEAKEAKKSAFIAAGVSVICLIATMGLIWTI